MTEVLRVAPRPYDPRGARRTRSVPRSEAHPDGHLPATSVLLDELGAMLFASMPRSDQRRKGAEYVRGLLVTDGRKSIRNIAIQTGGPTAEQGLHHFISDSTWDWEPVRLALARYLVRTAPPRAWVVRPTTIPKAGEHSVGVGRQFCPDAGQVVNAQHAVGVWAASEELTAPVDWRLHLPADWLEDRDRRSRAAVPDGLRAESFSDCAVAAFLATAARWSLPQRPVLFDARDVDVPHVVERLQAAGGPFLCRIRSTHRLLISDPALPGYGAAPVLAHRIVDAARGLRRPVLVPGGGWPHRTELAATVRVREPGSARPLLLLGVGRAAQSWPAEMWLTGAVDAPTAALARLVRLAERVDRDSEVADRVGMRDYAGRSFTGWHRHMTLASVAHTVAALAGATGRPVSGWTA